MASCTVLAGDKRLAFFDRKDRDKKEAQVVINTFYAGAYLPAGGTAPRSFIDHFRFWLNATNKKKHLFVTLDSGFVVIVSGSFYKLKF